MLANMKVFGLIILLFGATGWCCGPTSHEYVIDKASLKGTYRVRVLVTPAASAQSIDKARFEFFFQGDVIDSWDWQQQDAWEPGFNSLLPIQWVDDNVLHIGGAKGNAKFFDELIVSNNTGEFLKYVTVSYDRSDVFKIFGLAPGKEVRLSPTPWFTVKGGEFSFGYTGMTESGKVVGNVITGGERTAASTGPLKFHIAISGK
jgi:hypothetical protein